MMIESILNGRDRLREHNVPPDTRGLYLAHVSPEDAKELESEVSSMCTKPGGEMPHVPLQPWQRLVCIIEDVAVITDRT